MHISVKGEDQMTEQHSTGQVQEPWGLEYKTWRGEFLVGEIHWHSQGQANIHMEYL